MGVALKEIQARKHFSVAINWDEMPIEQHLEQYGSWLRLDGNCDVHLDARSSLSSIIDENNGVHTDGRFRAPPRCKIDVFHAMAVEDLLSHLYQTENEKVKRWLKVVTMFFVEFYAEEAIARKLDVSEYSVTRDKMLGLVRLATKFKLKSRIIGG